MISSIVNYWRRLRCCSMHYPSKESSSVVVTRYFSHISFLFEWLEENNDACTAIQIGQFLHVITQNFFV